MQCPECAQLIPGWIAALPIIPFIYLWMRGKWRKLSPEQRLGALLLLGLGIAFFACAIALANSYIPISETIPACKP